MVYQMTSEMMRGELISPSFNIGNYLQQRDNDPNFVMVEVGHGGLPVAYQQPEGFTGQRAYIGLETWMRGGAERGQKWISDLIAKKAVSDHIFYMHYEPGGALHTEPRSPDSDRMEVSYIGPFDTRSLLPDAAANEVFASNVFCDPHLSYARDRTHALLEEMARITDQNGMIILRETITPAFVSEIDRTMLDEIGLEVAALETDDTTDTWDQLERYYAGERFTHNLPGSYYLFLSKKQTD